MSNSLAKTLDIMFENFVEGYDAACVISQEAMTSFPDPQEMQRAGDTFYRMQDYNASVVTGLDVSGATKTDVIQRMVPTVYRSPDNIVYQFDAKELRDPTHKERMGKAAARRLAAEIDKNLYATVASNAGIVIKQVGALTWDVGATAEAVMLSKGVSAGVERKMFLNPLDYKDIAKDLGNRAYLGQTNLDAYERSRVPDIAGFKTFRTDNTSQVAATGTVSGTTVSGANQALTPAAMSGNLPQDNRQMVLNVAGANIANIKAGDSFTCGTNWCHQIDKSDTGQLATFRVLALAGGGANLTITPAIITSGPYQNVTAAPANAAPLVFLNTASKPINAFWADGTVALDYGKLAFPTDQGAAVMTATTKNGVPLLMSASFNHLTGVSVVRCTTLYATTVLDPEQVGIILANQT